MKNIKLFTVLSTFVLSTNAQNDKPYYACNYYGKQVNEKAICNMMGFSSRKEVERAVEEIVKLSGLKQNFYVMECPNTDNCFAAIQNGIRLIVYDGAFMRRVNNMTQTKDWGSWSILAHEIGHHLQGHTIIEGGSDPVKELEADRYSGHVMYELGATLKEAQAAIQKLTTDYDGGTHPPRSKRLAAIEEGYNNAKAKYSKKNTTPVIVNTDYDEKTTLPKKEPKPQQQPPRQTKLTEVEVVVDKVEKPVENCRPPEVGLPDSPMNNKPEVPKIDPNYVDNGNGNVKKTGCVDGDCMNGEGIAINSKTDEKYVGEWRNGKREGWGTEFNVDNSKKYEGNFKNNRYNGNGTLYFKNGERYVGKFKDGIMHGEGYYAYKNGDKLMATWVNGKKQGKAKIIYQSGNEGKKFFKDDIELR